MFFNSLQTLHPILDFKQLFIWGQTLRKNIFDAIKLTKMFTKIHNIKERNIQIVKVYEEGYSQHMIDKVLGMSQPALHGVIRRSRK